MITKFTNTSVHHWVWLLWGIWEFACAHLNRRRVEIRNIDCTLCSVKTFVQTTLINNKHTDVGSTLQYGKSQATLDETRQIWGIWKLRPAYSPETPNLGQIGGVLSPVTLKFDGWPWKTIGHLSFAVSSFVHHFVAIGEFKLELQSGNAQFESKWTIFFSHMTLQFDLWPWKPIGHLFNVISSVVHHFVAICDFKLEIQSGKGQFWYNRQSL